MSTLRRLDSPGSFRAAPRWVKSMPASVTPYRMAGRKSWMRCARSRPYRRSWRPSPSTLAALSGLPDTASAGLSLRSPARPFRSCRLRHHPARQRYLHLWPAPHRFAQLLRQLRPSSDPTNISMVNNKDLVPRVPFRGWDYSDVGEMIHFTENGAPAAAEFAMA